MTTLLLAAQVAGSVGMFGVIWTMQLVHYPLMAKVGRDEFAAYEAGHTDRIRFVVGPLMAVEGVSALLLAAYPPAGSARWLPWLGIAVLAVALGTTGLVSAPLHARLARGYDREAIDRLVRTNVIRTAAWTARAAIAIAMVS